MDSEPLTFEEHRELGQEMQKTQQRLTQLSRMVLDVYGSNNRCSFAFEKLNEAMEQVMEELEKQAIADCPAQDARALYR